jgi:hypothetical protein
LNGKKVYRRIERGDVRIVSIRDGAIVDEARRHLELVVESVLHRLGHVDPDVIEPEARRP